jgi:hypothetical protein
MTALLDGKWRPEPVGGKRALEQEGDRCKWWISRAWMIGGRLQNGVMYRLYYVPQGEEWTPAEFDSEPEAQKAADRLNRIRARQALEAKEDNDA